MCHHRDGITMSQSKSPDRMAQAVHDFATLAERDHANRRVTIMLQWVAEDLTARLNLACDRGDTTFDLTETEWRLAYALFNVNKRQAPPDDRSKIVLTYSGIRLVPPDVVAI